jgi:hypothetical protein
MPRSDTSLSITLISNGPDLYPNREDRLPASLRGPYNAARDLASELVTLKSDLTFGVDGRPYRNERDPYCPHRLGAILGFQRELQRDEGNGRRAMENVVDTLERATIQRAPIPVGRQWSRTATQAISSLVGSIDRFFYANGVERILTNVQGVTKLPEAEGHTLSAIIKDSLLYPRYFASCHDARVRRLLLNRNNWPQCGIHNLASLVLAQLGDVDFDLLRSELEREFAFAAMIQPSGQPLPVPVGTEINGPSAGQLAALVHEEDEPDEGVGMLSPREISQRENVPFAALKKRLERWRKKHPEESGAGWIEVPDARPCASRFLFRPASIRQEIEAMRGA